MENFKHIFGKIYKTITIEKINIKFSVINYKNYLKIFRKKIEKYTNNLRKMEI